MLHIVKQYKKLFMGFIIKGFSVEGGGYNESISEPILDTKESIISEVKEEKGKLSEEVLSIDKFKKTLKLGSEGEDVMLLQIFLFKKYKVSGAEKNGIFDAATETALKIYQIDLGSKRPDGVMDVNPDGISGGRIYDGLKKDLAQINTNEVKKEINIDLKTKIYNINETLKKGSKGEQVKTLQEFLITKGLLKEGGNDGIFGNGTERALKTYQKSLNMNISDGILTFSGTDKDKTLRAIKKEFFTEEENINGGEANQLIEKYKSVDKYLKAFNKIYGDGENIISSHNGLLGIVDKLEKTDLDELITELGIDFGKIDKSVLAKELGLDENSDGFKHGLNRTMIIAVLGLIMTGGAGLLLELFGVNYGEELQKGPQMSKIIKALEGSNFDFRKEKKEMFISPYTTVEGLNAMVDVMNGPDMDTANLKRVLSEIQELNWFQETFGVFIPEGYDNVQNLIEIFESTKDTKEAKGIVTEIYSILKKAQLNVEANYLKAKSEYEKIEKGPSDTLADINNIQVEIRYTESIKSLNKANKGLSELGDIVGKYTNFDNKRAQIIGENFDIDVARSREREIDTVLGSRELTQTTEKLHSEESFGFKTNLDKLDDKTYMTNLVKKMANETINGQTSVLSGIVRGIEQYYGISFSVEEFIEAFVNTAEKTSSNYILSNLGREKNQKFQGTIETGAKDDGGLFKITINGKDIYFKDICTNIVTVAHEESTTIRSKDSIPLIVSVNISGGNGTGGNENGGGIGGDTAGNMGNNGTIADTINSL